MRRHRGQRFVFPSCHRCPSEKNIQVESRLTPPANRGMNGVGKEQMTIQLDHKAGLFTLKGKHLVSHGSIKFSSERELSKLVADWPLARLVEIWNELPSVKKVTRFTNRDTAIYRIWAAIQGLASADWAAVVDSPERGTKAERVVALLKGPSGASLRVIMDLTGWQSHSVRSFISAHLGKRMGFQIQSFKRDGERIYRIRS